MTDSHPPETSPGRPGVTTPEVQQVQQARSFLFVPGDRPDRFAKAAAAGADAIILDLEDAVAPEAKDAARETTVAWVAAGGPAAVRVNAADTPQHQADVAALAGANRGAAEPGVGLLAILLPKAEDPQLAAAVAEQTGAPVIALVESARGVLQAHQLAAAPGVARLAFGHLDYAADLGSQTSREAVLLARSTLVLASRAAGLPGPIDGVTTALDDADVLTDDVRHAASLGMTGKLLIHPRQVSPTHAAYRPTEGEVAWAQRVLDAAAAGGAVRVDGDMVDAPVVARAQEIMRREDR